MAQTIFWWIFVLACIFAFLFSYGMVEDLIRQWRGVRSTRRNHEGSVADLEPPKVCSSSNGPTAPRGYDSPDLFREDTLIRIKRLEADIEEHRRNIDRALRSVKLSTREKDSGKCK